MNKKIIGKMHILVKNGTLGWKMCLQIKCEEKLNPKFCLWRKMTNMRMPLNKRVIFVCVCLEGLPRSKLILVAVE